MSSENNEAFARRRRILVVEDHDDTRKLILATLKLRDLEIEDVGDSDAGLAAFVRFKPDVVLLDVMMPGKWDGVGLCREIRGLAGHSVKIAFVTAKGQDVDMANGRHARADAYIVKPFSPLKFLETVDWLLNLPKATPQVRGV
ncbi:MAG: response regulator [Betaproteobacteria bacterium]